MLGANLEQPLGAKLTIPGLLEGPLPGTAPPIAEAVAAAGLAEGLPAEMDAAELEGAVRSHARVLTGEASASIAGTASETRAANASAVAAPQATVRAHGLDQADEILRQFRLHLAPDLRQATIELAPAELGRISIRLALTAGKLTAALRAEKRETLDVLGRHLPELRASLAQQGIQAERFELALGFHDESRRDAFGREPREPLDRGPAMSVLRPEDRDVLARAVASVSGIDTYA